MKEMVVGAKVLLVTSCAWSGYAIVEIWLP